MLAMKPTPHESFSRLGSYMPSADGRQSCSRGESSAYGVACRAAAGLESGAVDSASVTTFWRSNSDPLISRPLLISKGLASSAHLGRPAAPTGPPLALREP